MDFAVNLTIELNRALCRDIAGDHQVRANSRDPESVRILSVFSSLAYIPHDLHTPN
jgi:hypothetical protein